MVFDILVVKSYARFALTIIITALVLVFIHLVVLCAFVDSKL